MRVRVRVLCCVVCAGAGGAGGVTNCPIPSCSDGTLAWGKPSQVRQARHIHGISDKATCPPDSPMTVASSRHAPIAWDPIAWDPIAWVPARWADITSIAH